jgi:ATP-dependent Zn protease
MKRPVLFFILFIIAFTSSVQALSWAYPFVVWNGNVYEVKEEKVLKSKIGESIGEVKTRPNDMTGNYYGNASNDYPKGTKYFEINNISTKTAIAVQVAENQWQKAEYVHEAPFHWMDLVTKVLPFLILIVIAIAIVIIIRMKKSRSKKIK